MKYHFLNHFSALPIALAAIVTPAIVHAEEAVYYTTDFNTSSLANIGFTTLDSNNDGKTWTPQESKVTFRQLDGASISAIEKTPTTIEKGTNDDWLLTPSIRFEAGKTYNVSFIVCKYNYAAVEDAFEVKLGTAKNAASMTTTLVPLTEGDIPQAGGNSLWTKKFVVSVATTGDYFIGFHATGSIGQKIGITNLTIANGVGLVTPEAVNDLTLTPDPTGDKKVTISFTAPSRAKDGTALTSLQKVEVRRNGDLNKIIDNPVPGQKYTVEDMVAVSSLYTYTVTAFTEAGGGDQASAVTFVGVNTPAQATGVKAVNTANRKARISWEAPAVDKDGYPIAASIVKYDVTRKRIYTSEVTTVATDLTALSYEDEVPAEPEDAEEHQDFYTYSVIAKTAEGEAAPANADYVPLGEPYAVPYLESFPRGRATHIFTTSPLSGTSYWGQTSDFEDVSSADGDNGMIYLSGPIDGASSVHTGLIDLAGLPSPTLSYYTYNLTGCDPADHLLEVVVTATDGTVKNFDPYVPAMGWNKVILRLDEFVGKTVRINFNGYRKNNTTLHLDVISVSNIYPSDLKAASITVPEKVRTSEPFTVGIDVLNFGSEPSGDYSVELYCNDVLVDTYSASKLAVGAYDRVAFSRVHAVTDAETASYYAKIVYADDDDNSNNTTETVETIVRKNAYPKVSDLSGQLSGTSVMLSWSEPDTDKAQPYEVFDDFESYIPWSNTAVGDWIFVDCDKATIAGFSEGNMPGIPDYSEQSWWVFDNTHEDFNNGSFSTISGHQFLASMVSGIKGEGFVQNDDWLISPALYGGPQTIIVNARSYSLDASALESFEVLYSTGSTDPADFKSLAVYEEIPNQYTAYEIDLPDGARRFAVRNISYGKFVLMVDDITYVPAGDPGAFSINGYNVYRDGVRINNEPVEENEYEDITAPAGTHTYNVTVLYSAGESQLSNDWKTDDTGVEDVVVEEAEAEYFNLQGIRVAHPESGRTYIVRRGTEVRKTVVR